MRVQHERELLLIAAIFCRGSPVFSPVLLLSQAVEDRTTADQRHFARSSRGQPTFINLDEPYPNQVFTVLIWGSDRPKFGAPERVYSGRKICASGLIKLFRGVPETIVYAPTQLKVVP